VAVVTTNEVTPRHAFDLWQDLISDTFVPLTAAPVSDRPFSGRVVHSAVGQVALTTVRASGQHVRRTPRLIARSPDEYLLASIQIAGCGQVTQSGRSVVLRPGAMVFYDSTRPYDLHFPDRFEQLVVQVPRPAMPSRVLERATAVGLCDDGSTRVVVDFLRGLARQALCDPDDVAALAPHALGLVTALVSAAAGEDRGPAYLDRERVLFYLAEHSSDPALDADTVARACHLSRRSLYRLFEDQPKGFGETLRCLRVTAAGHLLRAEPHLPVAAVAARVGLGGAAQLHRAFRAVAGMTPAEYRAAGR
jgi:AraC-like DNA-binding protein